MKLFNKIETWAKATSVLLLVLLLSACVTVTEGGFSEKESTEKTVENLTQLGMGYIQKGRYDWARERLQRALSLNPDYAPANHAMGLIWRKEGELDLAEEYFAKSISQDSDFRVAQHNLGRLYVQQKRYDEAEKHLSRAANDRYYANRVGAFGDLARASYQQNNPVAAIEYYRQALRISPYNQEALVNVSTLLFEEANYDESLRYFDRFDRLVKRQEAKHTSHSLWLGIKLSRFFGNSPRVSVLAGQLQTDFPNSKEFSQYVSSLRGRS